MSETTESTQPNIPVTKSGRGRAILFNVLGLIVLVALGVLGGYQSGITIRKNTQSALILQQLGEQFQYALVDIQFLRYENAKQRLEYIIANDPTFPGVQEKLTEVLVLMSVPTPTPTPSLTPTPDFSGAEQAFARAQQYMAAQDWPNALTALDQMRKLDPTYHTSELDGMYYFALRNYGYNLITQQGNLEGGIYQLALAERFGPLDRDANGLREGARLYLIGASFWELDWQQTVAYFDQVHRGWSGLWDGTMTAAERFRIASMRYGDQLLANEKFCDAYQQYQNAEAVGPLDANAAKGANQAYQACYPPTEVPTATLEILPTASEPSATQPPVADTATPTPTP